MAEQPPIASEPAAPEVGFATAVEASVALAVEAGVAAAPEVRETDAVITETDVAEALVAPMLLKTWTFDSCQEQNAQWGRRWTLLSC